MISRQPIPFPLPCDTEKNVLQKSPSSNHQQGPPPPFPSLLTPLPASSPPNTLPLPREQLQWMPRVQQAGRRAPPCRGRGCVPGARTAAAAAAASPLAGRPAVHGCLSCCPYRKTVRVKIVDEEEYERQENFFIALGEPKWMERGISGVRSFMKKMKKRKKSESSLQTPNPENIILFLLLPLPPFLLLL